MISPSDFEELAELAVVTDVTTKTVTEQEEIVQSIVRPYMDALRAIAELTKERDEANEEAAATEARFRMAAWNRESYKQRAESAEALVREVAELDSFTKSMYDRSSNFLGLGCWECGAIKNSEHEEYCVLGKCKRHAEEQS